MASSRPYKLCPLYLMGMSLHLPSTPVAEAELCNRAVTYVAALACTCIQYNVIDSPVGIVPVTRVDPKLDELTEAYTAPGKLQEGSPFINYCLYRASKHVYDVKKMEGLPVGVQVVGRKWEEEKVIEMMKVVDSALGPRGFGPGAWKVQRDTKVAGGNHGNGAPGI